MITRQEMIKDIGRPITWEYKIKFLNTYDKKGKTMYRYSVELKSPEDDYKSYEYIQGQYYIVDKATGKPYYYTSKDLGDDCHIRLGMYAMSNWVSGYFPPNLDYDPRYDHWQDRFR